MHLQVIVPSTINKTDKISESEFRDRVKEVENKLIRLFEGHTTIKGQGGYYSSDKGNIFEDVAVVHVFTMFSRYKAHDLELRDYLMEKKEQWGQESLAYVIKAPGLGERSFLI